MPNLCRLLVVVCCAAGVAACAGMDAPPRFAVTAQAARYAPCTEKGALAEDEKGTLLLICDPADEGFSWQKKAWSKKQGLIWKAVGLDAWIAHKAAEAQGCTEPGALALDQTGAVMACVDDGRPE